MDGPAPEISLLGVRATLRPWRRSDAPALEAACQDPEIGRWVSIPQPFTLDDAVAHIEEAMASWQDGTGAAFAIVDRAADQLLGTVARFGPDGHQATIGCWVTREARGRGIGTAALRAVTEWTFRSTDVIRVDAFIMVGNEASERMTQRAGFQRKGVLRSWDLLRGQEVDCVVYSRLRDDSVRARLGRSGDIPFARAPATTSSTYQSNGAAVAGSPR